MKYIFSLILALLIGGNLSAFTVYDGSYGKAELIDTVASSDIVTEISFMTSDIVNIRRYKKGCKVTKNNLVVTLQKQDVKVSVSDKSTYITLASSDVSVKYYKSTGKVVFYDNSGNIMLRENDQSTLTACKDGQFDSYKVKQSFNLTSNERLYGLGQIQDGNMSQRGLTYNYMIEGNTMVWIPYVQSTKGYSVYWDNASPTSYSDNANVMSFESAVGYGVDYYFMLGSATDGNTAIQNMRTLTGQVPMIPLWAYGYFQSKERYESADETMSVVSQYRRLGVPLDCVVQDWQYWGDNDLWNGMTFGNPKFSNYQEMVDSVHNMNAHILISAWANFGPDTEPYAYFKKNNELIKQGDNIMTSTYPSDAGVAIYDTYNTDARDAYWKYLYSGVVSKGIDAYWLDSSEPDHYQGGDDREETFNFVTGLGCTWRSVRNAFPLMHVGGVYTHHRAESALGGKRCMILTRSGYAGMQRYGANTWSGDATASWETLRKQIPAALNYTACGNPNWNSDIGAFFNGDLKGPGNDEYNELYARWFQFGTFCPMMRSHGAGTDKAIYVWGKRGKPYFDNVERYINMRYAMLPYIYSTAWTVHNDGQLFMKALGIDFQSDANALDVKDEYMFGGSFLVAPVMSYGAESRGVYLPTGTKWIDLWTGEAADGGQTVNKSVELSTLPLYVRAGSIIPWAKKSQYASVAAWDTLQIRVYPGADDAFTLYEDEGDNYNYEGGSRSTIKFTWDDANKKLTVGGRDGSFKGMLQKRVFDVVLVSESLGIGDSLSTQYNHRVDYDGTEQTVTIDSNELHDAEYTKNNANPTVDLQFDMSDFNPSISGTGSISGNVFKADNRGFGGWWSAAGINLSGYNYLVAELGDNVPSTVSLRAYTQNNYGTEPIICKADGKSNKLYIDLNDINIIYGVGLWSSSSHNITINKVYLTSEKPADATGDASVPYAFKAKDRTTGNGGRVSQGNISYNTDANTITVKATGAQNTCLQLDPSKTDSYYIPQGKPYLCVKCSNVGSATDASQLWWRLGQLIFDFNATKTLTAQDGDIIVAWDLSAQLPTLQERLPLCLSNQGSFIFCFGMTSTTGASVISDIGFYSEDEIPNIGTGISDITVESTGESNVTYNLQGVRMSDGTDLPHGIYI